MDKSIVGNVRDWRIGTAERYVLFSACVKAASLCRSVATSNVRTYETLIIIFLSIPFVQVPDLIC